MKSNVVTMIGALAVVLGAVACEKSSPTTPTNVGAAVGDAAVTDASTGVSVGAPQPVSPAENAQFRFVEQPVKLTFKNGVTTGSTPLTYTVEVATDSGFTSKVYVNENVVEGGGGQTNLTISKLQADRAYYWRARSNVGSAGPNSRVRSLKMGAEVILQTPVVASPQQNEILSGKTVTLSVNNVAKTGPAAQVVYRFEVYDSASLTNLVFVQTVNEGSGSQTSVSVPAGTTRGTFFWRAQASDPFNLVTTAFSPVSAFVYQPFSLADATILNNPPDLANWEESTKITSVVFTPTAMLVDFDKRDGPNRWPESGFGDGGIQYTLGLCLNINGHWYCSAAIQFWYGRDLEASGYPQYIYADWFYDNRWGPMKGYQPQQGELVGIFVAQGNLRDFGKTSVKERSDVVLMPFGGTYIAP